MVVEVKGYCVKPHSRKSPAKKKKTTAKKHVKKAAPKPRTLDDMIKFAGPN